MPDDRIPKQLLYGELGQVKSTVGGQRKRFMDSLKTSLKHCNISTHSWEFLAPDRPSWCNSIVKGAHTAEERRSSKLSRNVLHASPEQSAPTAQHLPTSALPVGEAFLPGLVSSATSGHTVAARLLIRCHGHLRIRKTNNNNIN